jgi:mannosyltransferase OCH1-like enzyme
METEMRIPKKIHYCWFGKNPLPEDAVRCIESWKKYCPDYEIIEWNEDNFPIDYNDYVREAYEAKKWAFVSDVARLYALVTEGGVYMDTDVEVVRPIDGILKYSAVSGFESSGSVPTGLMAAEQGHPFFKKLLDDYSGDKFIMEDGSYNIMTNVERITNTCLEGGLVLNDTEQTVCGFTFLPHDYFCPKDVVTHKVFLTENTYAIHHFGGSWLSEEKRYAKEFRVRHPHIPRFMALHVSCFVAACKFRSFGAAIKDVFAYFSDRKKKKKKLRELNKKGNGKG